MRTVLILAYYFPPMGLGGVQRPLKFSKYLPQFGWRPIVATVKDVSYYSQDTTLLGELPEEVVVSRSGSLDPLRLAYCLGKQEKPIGRTRGRARSLAQWMLFPDNQIGWVPFVVMRALHLIRRYAVDAILTTSPPASSHLAGYLIHRLTGLPWVIDFRDAWTGGEFDQAPSFAHRWLACTLQQRFIHRATHVIAVSQDIADGLTDTLPGAPPVTVIPNGYDSADFAFPVDRAPANKFILTCCGALNAARNPEPLFQALQRMSAQQTNLADLLEVRLIGEDLGLSVETLIRKYKIQHLVTHFGYLTHEKAVTQILAANALVLFITSESHQVKGVPTGKIYEYLASGKPILAIAPDGAASDLIKRYDRGQTIPPDDVHQIAMALGTWIRQYGAGDLPEYPVEDEPIRPFSRFQLTDQLAQILNHVVTP
ncbi:MAG: glycosyltransferase [Candidatus Latescibacteria bacterium]|jgi:glycosyltransferase involved in cell wall biosynthesis|nr:glycosyltransferase [Candidatus Latescibacterota bacterium]